MHRFRKKSDAKRTQVPENLIARSNSRSPQPTISNTSHNSTDPLPALPPATDFRTSLILPSLSRRFTLLRTSTGDPVPLDDIRSKIAEQRSRGAEHQIFEEEEDMIVEALAQLRTPESLSPIPPAPNNTAVALSPGGMFAAQQDSSINFSFGGDSDYPSSITSGIAPSVSSSLSPTYPRSSPSSPSSPRTNTSSRYSSKRMSNNMFSSGRLHDTNYLRSVSKASVPSSRSTASLTGSDSHGGSVRSTRSIRGMDVSPGRATPEQDTGGGGDITMSEKAPISQPSSLTGHPAMSAVSSRVSKEFTLQQVRRTSLALEEVIRGIEEDAEETIMVPRSRAGTVNSRAQSPKASETPSAIGTPIPWMTDEARVDDRDDRDDEPILPSNGQPTSPPAPASPSPSPGPYNRPGTTSPTPRLPGYIPGMTRPLTPRDVDSDRDDGQTGYSTTPRARSPALPQFSHHSSAAHSFSSSRHHRNVSLSSDGQSILPPSILRPSRSSGQQQLPPLRSASPAYGGRSRGNSTSSPQVPSPAPSPAPDERFKNDFLIRRPLSPLIGAQTAPYGGGSRPTTPSSPGPWGPSSPLAQVHTIPPRENDSSRPGTPGHSRNASIMSSTLGDGMSVVMPLAGPALPDSPLMGDRQGANGGMLPMLRWDQTANRNGDVSVGAEDEEFQQPRPSAAAAKIAARAPTPVHTHSRTPSASESGYEPMLLNRTVSKRSQKRMQSPTPPPQRRMQSPTPPQIQPLSPIALHTPSSSSNSSNLNVNMNPLFSPMLNTSASSLVSVGSSYHSWADENGKKNGWDQLVEYDSQRSAWQELLSAGGRGLNHVDDASETLASPDQELHSLTGLTKGDLALVQTRLVADAQSQSRRGFDPPRSPMRRRRMSNSRTSLSAAQSGRESGANSPAPPRQPTPVTENGNVSSVQRHSPENTSRANALLETVLNSIQSQATSSTPPSSDVPSAEPASTTDDDSSSRFPSVSSSGRESREDDMSALRYKALADAISAPEQPPQVTNKDVPQSTTPPVPDTSQSPEEDSGEATEVPATQFWRSPQSPLYRTPGDAGQLVREVSRRTAAATAALKSPSQTHVVESDAFMRRKTARRIDLQKISSPQLVSSSTSVDAVPIAPAQSSAPPLKFSQRFKKLRGTLRTKPSTPNGEESAPPMAPNPSSSTQSPYLATSALRRLPSPAAPAQTLRYTPAQTFTALSATDQGTFKVPVSPPPASAGPGLKSFIMNRFRKSKKESEAPSGRSGHYSDSTSPVSPANEREFSRGRHGPVSPPPGPGPSPPATKPKVSQDTVSIDAERARSPTPDLAAVNKLFNAASELGLDQSAITELLARSTSSSSRKTTWTQASATTFAGTRSNQAPHRQPVPRMREGAQDRSPDRPQSPPEQVAYKATARPKPVNRPPEGEIVRRTIIFASDNPSVSELQALTGNSSSSGRPQRSDSSASLHSTSGNREPPVPKLPAGLGSSKAVNSSESGPLYDVYPQDQSFSSLQNGSPGTMLPVPGDIMPSGEQGQGPALEVLQLSNGQVIWSVLDSLRAAEEDDSESMFRRSMASSRGDDDLEVRFKEHKRWSSKGSNISQASQSSRRRPGGVSGGSRPETKLFKTNSLTIGRLIEDLSKDMEAGSFNFMRPATASPNATSAATSFHSDASGSAHQVERDLDALLKVINPR